MLTNEPYDKTYSKLSQQHVEIEHAYGKNVHLLADTFLLTKLALLCTEQTKQPLINNLVKDLYEQLIRIVINGEFPRMLTHVRTRMAAVHERGVWTGEIIDPSTRVVTVNIMRAGTLPSQVCFDHFNRILDPHGVRQDHLVVARKTNPQDEVIGSYLGDSKIGGSIDDAIVLFPDPMGATGNSMCEVIKHYKTKVAGNEKKLIALNLIVTPEYIKKLHHHFPNVIIYALRLDRGGSPAQVLEKMPGADWDHEIGLTEKQYIIPGGGGFGEIINNSYC